MLERRAYSRLGAFIPCQLQAGAKTHDGRLLDISLGGASVSSRYVPSKGESLSVLVQLRDQREISLHCTVVRITRYVSDKVGEACRFGIRFDGVTPEAMMLLTEAMSRKG